MKCTECEEELDEEEVESPRRNKNNDIVCDQCYEEQYSHICPICEEIFDEDFSKVISPKYLLITEDASEDIYLSPGIYEIVSYPFFRDDTIEITLIASAMRKILDVPKDVCESDVYYVCEDCVEKIKNEQTK